MSNNIEESVEQRSVDRRTVIKGAAWSVPVIATAVAAPLAAASAVTKAQINITSDCGGPGIDVCNNGSAAYEGEITVTEYIKVRGALAGATVVAGAIQTTLRAEQALLGSVSAGGSATLWTTAGRHSEGLGGTGSGSYSEFTRTITIPAGLTVGQCASWRVISGLASIVGVSSARITHNATIIEPTGDVVGTAFAYFYADGSSHC